jgi:hypothetical protein
MLLAGQSLSNIGNYSFTIAFPWLMLGPHGNVEMLGTVIAVAGVARMAGIPIGGWLADRLGSWRVMLWSDCSQIVFSALLALLAYLLAPSLVWVLPVEACAGLCGGLFIPSSMSVIPSLLPEDQVGRGVALYSGGLQLAGVIGPAIGGVLVSLAGAPCALAIDASSYLASTLSLLGIRKFMTAAVTATAGDTVTGAVDNEIDDVSDSDSNLTVPGLAFGVFARRAHLLQVILGVAVVFYLAYPGAEEVAIPALAQRNFGASGFGALLTVQAVCSLLGTLLASKYARIRTVPYLQAALIAVFGTAFAFVPYAGGLLGALAAMSVFSVAMSWQGVGIITLLQTWTPRHLLGRTMSVLMTVSQGLTQISVVVLTVIIHHIGPAAAFPLAGAASVFTALGIIAFPAFRHYRLGDTFTLDTKSVTLASDSSRDAVAEG